MSEGPTLSELERNPIAKAFSWLYDHPLIFLALAVILCVVGYLWYYA